MRFKVQMISESRMSMAYTGHGETLKAAVGEMVVECLSMNHELDVEFLSKNLLQLAQTAKNIEKRLRQEDIEQLAELEDPPRTPCGNGDTDA